MKNVDISLNVPKITELKVLFMSGFDHAAGRLQYLKLSKFLRA